MRRLSPPLSAVFLLCLSAGLAQALPPGFSVSMVHPGLSFPTGLRFAPDGRLFYLELNTGRIMAFSTPTATTPAVWATVPVASGGERGLLGLAFHPDFPDTPYVFVYHTNPSPLVNRVVRLTDQGGVGVGYTVFYDNLPADAASHHGGRLAFGPDRMLYVTFGDQDFPTSAQDPNDERGKILRLGPGGKAAPANPFGPGNPAALLGVRNPFGLCFDPLDGTGYFTENGPECDDELNLVTLGENYGWGPSDFCGGQPAGAYPALQTFTSPIAPTGCCVYRGGTYPGYLDGNLFFGAYNTASLHRVKFAPGSVTVVDTVEVFASIGAPVLDVTVGPDGRLWFCTTNAIGRIVEPGAVSVEPDPIFPAFAVAPNPFRDAVAFGAIGDIQIARIDVLDPLGRRLRQWRAPAGGRAVWDGRDESGRAVPAGVYLVRAVGPGLDVTRRLVRVAR